jgi:predicted nucleic acid-binding Zn finger protein
MMSESSMPVDDEMEIIEKICLKAKEDKKLSGDEIFVLFKRFDQRLLRALEAIKTGKVTAHVFQPSGRKLWTVMGSHGEYVILPNAKFCNCDDFYFQITKKLNIHVCYHLIAQRIASMLGVHEKVEHSDRSYAQLLEKLSTPEKAEAKTEDKPAETGPA